MSTENFIVLGVFAFIGLFLGWFFRNGIGFWSIVAIIIFSPIIVAIADLDFWPITLSFIAGFLIHTWKPIYRKIQEL